MKDDLLQAFFNHIAPDTEQKQLIVSYLESKGHNITWDAIRYLQLDTIAPCLLHFALSSSLKSAPQLHLNPSHLLAATATTATTHRSQFSVFSFVYFSITLPLTTSSSTSFPPTMAARIHRQDWDAPGLYKDLLASMTIACKPTADTLKEIVQDMNLRGYPFTFHGLKYSHPSALFTLPLVCLLHVQFFPP